ncbi:MAG: bifunctional riboflavin kinase/FAD synthetase, partial [Myxococcales bacterium]|nr:bifunctional riboflavin kinase/FAD synthetase [Myxococcales bacterium]
MEVVRGSESVPPSLRRGIVTIGNFDGLHLGHQRIMEIVTGRASALRCPAVVFTFDPHPRKVIRPNTAPALLTTPEQKLKLLEAARIDAVVIEPFTEEFARHDAGAFVRDVVHARLAPREVYVGYDFHFGRDREGSRKNLTELGPALGFSVTVIPEVTVSDEPVNSTRIRALLAGGDIESAGRLLGRSYAVRGEVASGDRRGRTIGFPTANLRAENEVLPQEGVYATRVTFLDDGTPPRGAVFDAVTNVGRRPTFKESDPVLAETHLFDFAEDVYGRRIEVHFIYRIRGERKFDSPDALVTQIRV